MADARLLADLADATGLSEAMSEALAPYRPGGGHGENKTRASNGASHLVLSSVGPAEVHHRVHEVVSSVGRSA